jgi:hypothetical protein
MELIVIFVSSAFEDGHAATTGTRKRSSEKWSGSSRAGSANDATPARVVTTICDGCSVIIVGHRAGQTALIFVVAQHSIPGACRDQTGSLQPPCPAGNLPYSLQAPRAGGVIFLSE